MRKQYEHCSNKVESAWKIRADQQSVWTTCAQRSKIYWKCVQSNTVQYWAIYRHDFCKVLNFDIGSLKKLLLLSWFNWMELNWIELNWATQTKTRKEHGAWSIVDWLINLILTYTAATTTLKQDIHSIGKISIFCFFWPQVKPRLVAQNVGS